jgi:hypothetical protein
MIFDGESCINSISISTKYQLKFTPLKIAVVRDWSLECNLGLLLFATMTCWLVIIVQPGFFSGRSMSASRSKSWCLSAVNFFCFDMMILGWRGEKVRVAIRAFVCRKGVDGWLLCDDDADDDDDWLLCEDGGNDAVRFVVFDVDLGFGEFGQNLSTLNCWQIKLYWSLVFSYQLLTRFVDLSLVFDPLFLYNVILLSKR